MIKHLFISGHVQGVFFRESMLRKALQLNVTGWVRNRRNGMVEAIVSGTEDAVKNMIAWAGHGPDTATVIGVEVHDGEGDYISFEKRETF